MNGDSGRTNPLDMAAIRARLEQARGPEYWRSLEELASTENRIGFARQAYNDAAMQFNNKVEMFPGNIVAGMFSFTKSEFFEIEDAAQREVPQVKFS